MALLTAICLEDYRIQRLPSSAFYVSDFISLAEEQVLLDKVCNGSLLVT
jgi:alkylated DNA repair protein alkB family protein 6